MIAHTENNKMSATALGVVFGSNIMRAKGDGSISFLLFLNFITTTIIILLLNQSFYIIIVTF